MSFDQVTKRLVLVLVGSIPFFFFLHTNWAKAALLGYYLTGLLIVVLADDMPSIRASWFWKAMIPVTCIHLAIVTGLVSLDYAFPTINRVPRMLYCFAALVFAIECRLAFWIIDVSRSKQQKSPVD